MGFMADYSHLINMIQKSRRCRRCVHADFLYLHKLLTTMPKKLFELENSQLKSRKRILFFHRVRRRMRILHLSRGQGNQHPGQTFNFVADFAKGSPVLLVNFFNFRYNFSDLA